MCGRGDVGSVEVRTGKWMQPEAEDNCALADSFVFSISCRGLMEEIEGVGALSEPSAEPFFSLGRLRLVTPWRPRHPPSQPLMLIRPSGIALLTRFASRPALTSIHLLAFSLETQKHRGSILYFILEKKKKNILPYGSNTRTTIRIFRYLGISVSSYLFLCRALGSYEWAASDSADAPNLRSMSQWTW